MNKQKTIALQLCMNIITLLGVIFYNWSVFGLIYLYWLETLGYVFLNAIKILTAQNYPKKSPHIKKAFTYLTINIGILFFYLSFIIIFIGFTVAEKQDGVGFIKYLCFLDTAFRYTVFGFFMVKLVELMLNYFFYGVYRTASPNDYFSFFDARTILIHIVIVLGFFTFKFFSERFDTSYGLIGFATVFVVVKSIADVVSIYFFSKEKQAKTH